MSSGIQTTSRILKLDYRHQLHFTRQVFAVGNPLLADVIRSAGHELRSKVVVFYDRGLLVHQPELAEMIAKYFVVHAVDVELAAVPVGIVGGERGKNDWDCLQEVWSAINAAGLCRHSLVVAVGGGAVLDLVGFGASTAHRGIPLIRIPTTALSQGDGGVGVKNAVNYFGKKNWLGNFAVPHAVINDSSFLDMLPEREKRGGLVEAVKVSLIRDCELFAFIEIEYGAGAEWSGESFKMMIRRSALVHLDHIATGGDPFEQGTSRPLDFGHWTAHKLEPLSEFSLSHGEAVAIGMALDLVYANLRGLLEESVLERILALWDLLGFPIYSSWLEALTDDGEPALLAGLEEFREHLGGRLTIPLVTDIGVCVDVHEMDAGLLHKAIAALKKRDAVSHV